MKKKRVIPSIMMGQDENEQENQDQLLKQLHKRYKQAAQDQESKLTLNDWCKGQKQNTCKGENDIAQQQLFTSGETVKKDAEQTKSQIHEQKQEKMNEHNMDEDIATDQNEQVPFVKEFLNLNMTEMVRQSSLVSTKV
ncbi:hypothetical protein ACE6H2_016105 [Prunus campanulata]